MNKTLATVAGLVATAAASAAVTVIAVPAGAAVPKPTVAKTTNITVTRTCLDSDRWNLKVTLNTKGGATYGLRVIDQYANGPVATRFARPSASFTFSVRHNDKPVVLLVGQNGTKEGIRMGASRTDACGSRS